MYIVCDSSNHIAILEISLFGEKRAVFAIFEREQDALHIGQQVERATGIPHAVRKESDTFSPH